MIFLIITIFGFFFLFSFLTRKYRSHNFPLVMVFGKKGSGKSTLLVKDMIKDLRKGWNVYTDMADVAIKGVHLISVDDLRTFTPPSYSSVYLDEVGITFDNRSYKTFPSGLRDWFIFQRHYKCKVVLASQSFNVDLKLRQLTDILYLQTNIANVIGITRPIYRTVTLTDATSQGESRIADQLRFGKIWTWRLTWIPRYQKFFDSFQTPPRELIPSKELDGPDPARRQLRQIVRAWGRKK